jgi:hypothetical protein
MTWPAPLGVVVTVPTRLAPGGPVAAPVVPVVPPEPVTLSDVRPSVVISAPASVLSSAPRAAMLRPISTSTLPVADRAPFAATVGPPTAPLRTLTITTALSVTPIGAVISVTTTAILPLRAWPLAAVAVRPPRTTLRGRRVLRPVLDRPTAPFAPVTPIPLPRAAPSPFAKPLAFRLVEPTALSGTGSPASPLAGPARPAPARFTALAFAEPATLAAPRRAVPSVGRDVTPRALFTVLFAALITTKVAITTLPGRPAARPARVG